MVTLLRRLFIRNFNDVNNEKVRTSTGILASVGGIIINLILFVIKLVIGLISHSISIVSDAINNLSDLFSCFVNLFGFKLASKPADKHHPFGHQRIEYIAGMIVAFFIIAMTIVLGYSAVQRLISQDKNVEFSIISFVILGIGILGKGFLAYFYHGLGKAINSLSLKAAMQDSINDLICTSCVLIASIFQYFYKEQLWFLDSAVSLCVSVFVLVSGIKLIIETSSPLIGENPDKDFVHNIVKDIKEHTCVLGIHDLIIHSYGPSNTFISVHVEVDGYSDIMKVHDEIDNIEFEIKSKYKADITIHMDPIDTRNKRLPILKEELQRILKSYSENLLFHDFRMVKGDTHTNLIFDVVYPVDVKIDEIQLDKYIKDEFKKYDSKLNCVITIEKDYTF